MKRLTLIGIGLVLLALIFIYLSSVNTLGNASVNSFLIPSHNSLVIPIAISNDTVYSSLYYSNSTNSSSYLMDSYAFSQVQPYLNSSSLLNQTIKEEGHGVYQITYLNSSGIFPNRDSYVSPPNYNYNGTDIFSNGTYYEIFQNSGNSNITIHYSSGLVQFSAYNPAPKVIFYMLAALMFIVGICLIGYSVMFKKEDKAKALPAASKAASEQSEVDRLYAKFDKKKAKARPKKKARKKGRAK